MLDTTDPLLYHGEPIWRDGKLVGRITSAMFGHSLGRPLGLGYVLNGNDNVTCDWLAAGQFELEIAMERVSAKASLKPFFDPLNQRVKA
jgi:4-methylaminobutanoate oxidase (formaldehyde-forming)